jgi:hypothetical protein
MRSATFTVERRYQARMRLDGRVPSRVQGRHPPLRPLSYYPSDTTIGCPAVLSAPAPWAVKGGEPQEGCVRTRGPSEWGPYVKRPGVASPETLFLLATLQAIWRVPRT